MSEDKLNNGDLHTEDGHGTGGFSTLLAGLRAGDDEAANTLIKEYSSELQRVIGFELRKTRPNPVYEANDVFQSVLRTFFVRVGLGQFELRSPDDLRKLLARIAHNKVVRIVRRETADRRGGGMVRSMDCDPNALSVSDNTPSQVVSTHELLERFENLLPGRVRQIRDLRREGLTWDEISAQLGGTSEGLRKELSRGIDEAAKLLGIEDLQDV